MTKYNKVICMMVILLGLCSISVQAETIYQEKPLIFDHIGREEGLKDLSVSNMVQDRDGYIWIGTQGGLFRYDGIEMLSYRTNPFQEEGIIHNLIQTMYYDESDHVLWLGTYQGVSRFDITSQHFTNYTVEDNGLSNSVVVSINKDAHGTMWFGTMNGLNRLDEASNQFDVFNIEEEVVRSIYVDSIDRLLVGTYNGLYFWDDTLEELVRVSIDYPSLYVMVVEEFEEGIITIGMWDGGVLELDLAFNVLAKHNYEDNRVYALHHTNDETLWVGTWGGGLFRDMNDVITRYEGSGKDGDIGHPVVYSFLEDREGKLWIGTNGDGIYKVNAYKRNDIILKNDPEDSESLDAGKINAFYKDQIGRLWIAIYNKGLNIYDQRTDTLTKYNSSNSDLDDQVTAFILYNKQIILGTAGGLFNYNEVEGFEALSILPEETIVYALEVDANNHLWVGTYLDGLYELDDNLSVVNHYTAETEPALSDDLIYDLMEDSKGRLWVGTNNGLDLIDTSTGLITKSYNKGIARNTMPGNVVRKIYEAKDGIIWIGLFGGGLSKYNEISDDFTSYTEAEGLTDNSVVGIVESMDHHIWAITHTGVSTIDPTTGRLINWTDFEGIGAYNFTCDGYVGSDDSIYFGGTFGVIKMPPMIYRGEEILPPVYITDMYVLNESVDKKNSNYNNKSFSFDANENLVAFEFNALDYESSNQMRYSYQLKGFDEAYIDSGNRAYVSYSNLKPGAYEFLVKARTARGNYTTPVSVKFVISKPWYLTIYAFFVYLLVFVFLIFSLIKIRENKELTRVSSMDQLTAVFNRRYLDKVLEDYIQLATRSHCYLSVIMIDIDDFKSVNDQYGHVFGDEHLKGLAKNIKSKLPRQTDFCARYGGDEFVVVLYDTDEVGARIVTDKIVEGLTTRTVEYDGVKKDVTTTISLGMFTVIPKDTMTVEMMIGFADKALYEAKKTGKNKMVVYKEILE